MDVKLWVGRRLRKRPRSGMKREFCTLLRVLSVDTSGSWHEYQLRPALVKSEGWNTYYIKVVDKIGFILSHP